MLVTLTINLYTLKSYIRFKHFLTSSILWFRIVLSYCVVGALLVALASAYFQKVNILLIISIMLFSFSIGIYAAEATRRKEGLIQYQEKLRQQKHLHY